MYVSIIGGDVGSCNEEDRKNAEEIGKRLAKKGVTIVCGGRGGVMEAVCRGAKSEGGTTIGILPSTD
ncbi:MAG: Rossmann fold nucleotide-binding protein, partial [Thermoplasmatota archaeon]